MTRGSFGLGRVAAGEYDWTVGDPEAPLVIVGHQLGNHATSLSYLPAFRDLVWRLAKHFLVCVPDLGHTTFGNALGRGRAEQVRLTLGASGPVGLVGVSHGASTLLAWANQYPAHFGWFAGVMPAISLNDLKAHATVGPQLNACFAGGYSNATYGAQSSPEIMAPTLPVGDYALFLSSNDDVCKPAKAAAFAATVGASTQSIGAHGHTQAGIDAGLPPAADWIIDNFA